MGSRFSKEPSPQQELRKRFKELRGAAIKGGESGWKEAEVGFQKDPRALEIFTRYHKDGGLAALAEATGLDQATLREELANIFTVRNAALAEQQLESALVKFESKDPQWKADITKARAHLGPHGYLLAEEKPAPLIKTFDDTAAPSKKMVAFPITDTRIAAVIKDVQRLRHQAAENLRYAQAERAADRRAGTVTALHATP